MDVNKVVIEDIESKARLYNKPMPVIKYEAPKIVHVIDNTKSASDTIERPLVRIATLEKQVKKLLERVQDLEDIVNQLLL
jgi:chaperonin cofactor prefoldin